LKRIPPSARAAAIFLAQDISTFIPGSIFFFMVTLLERRREME